MNYFGLASPFTMQTTQFDDEACSTSDGSLSPSSSHSSGSYLSFDHVPLPTSTTTSTQQHYDHNAAPSARSRSQSPPPQSATVESADASLGAPAEPQSALYDQPTVYLEDDVNQDDNQVEGSSFASAQAAMAAQNSSHSQNLIGHRIDNSSAGYRSVLEFVSILGLGAYGVVYLARDIAARPSAFPSSRAHPQLGNQPLYAVKCLNKVGLDSRQRNFQRREILLHGMASEHSNVVTLHNVIEEDTCIYVVLQFCDEGDLFGMITERQRYLGDDELIRKVFLQIVDAVEFCHDRNIYHRDLKPENILCLDDGKKVMLADFGLATSERTSGDFGCGSTFYMSPECQGGLFQRLQAYSTPHNDIWSLGVILVNLTCGRNPWKQACPSDETFCAYLGNPDFLRSILPISDHTNRILKRIFALNPAARISLKDLRREIVSVKTFVMSEDELKHATRATKEAARAFGQVVPEDHEEAIPEVDEDEEIVEAMLQNAGFQEDVVFTPARTSPSAARVSDDDKTPSPSTPTGEYRRAAPITPPATPRRPSRPPPLNQIPVRREGLRSSYSTDGSLSNSSAEESDASSSDTLASDEDNHAEATPRPRRRQRRRRQSKQEVFFTPPQTSRSVFAREDYNGPTAKPLPPSPVTPTTAHRRPRAAATRSVSPRAAAAAIGCNSASRRTRRTSVDSSSSSSGASNSQPPTPTGLPPHHYYAQPHVYDTTAAQGVQIVPQSPPKFSTRRASAPAPTAPVVHTAYYPLFADWDDVAQSQQSHYQVQLPPPVFLPAFQEDGDETMECDGAFDFPLPPNTHKSGGIPTGYYTREPAAAGERPSVHVREATIDLDIVG